MKLCVPAPVHGQHGGSATFRAGWLAWLAAQGHDHTTDLDDRYDVLFVNAWQTPYMRIYQRKRAQPDLIVAHRVDGAGRDYGRTDLADALQQTVNTLADVTIFQSAYSRTSTRETYNIITHDGPIIHNPVDTDLFRPDGAPHPDFGPPEEAKPRILTAIWSNNRRKGAWRLPGLARAHPEVEFIYAGVPLDDAPDNLHQRDRLSRPDLARLMRSAHVFVNLSENDPCPNVVLEALASGLPVLYVPNGGTPELVGEAGLPLADDAAFGSALARLLADRPRYAAAARERAITHFAEDVIFPRYLAAIEAARREPLPSLWRHMFSHGQRARVWLREKWLRAEGWLTP